MTHETKAGLLVSCSFLCLVGAVGYVKMTQGDVSPSAADTAKSKELPWPVAPPDAVPASKSDPGKANPEATAVAGPLTTPGKLPDGLIQVRGTDTKGDSREPPKRDTVTDVVQSPSAPPAGGPAPPPTAPGAAETARVPVPAHGAESAAKDDPFGHENALPSTAARTGGAPSVGGERTATEPAAAPTSDGSPLSGSHGNLPDPSPPTPSHDLASPHVPDPAPTVGTPLGAASPGPAPTPTGIDSPLPSGPAPTAPLPPATGATGGTPAPAVVGTNPPSNPDPVPAPIAGGSPLGSSNPPPVSGSAAGNPQPTTIPAAGNPAPTSPATDTRPISESAPPAPGTPATGGVILGTPHSSANPAGNSTPGVMPPDARIARPPEADTIPPSAATAPAASQLAQGTPSAGATPLGTPPSVASPPISVPITGGAGGAALVRAPAVAGGPVVESFDEETHVCKPNDSFASICRDKYHAEKYAQALLMFNRSHPLAADGIRSEPPLLRPGQPVYIPPLEILEKRYPALIADPAPAAVPVPGVGAPPAGAALPPTAGVPTTAHASPVGERQYTVQEKPETFYEIAKRVLGDGYRWSDIWRLNPSFASNAPLPVGTVVRVPGQ